MAELFDQANPPATPILVIDVANQASELAKQACARWLGLSTAQSLAINPDFYYWDNDTFSVTDSRQLKAKQNLSASGQYQKIFLLKAQLFTNEAQNALLKTLEDSQQNIFIFIAPSLEGFLPTFLSRVIIEQYDTTAGKQIEDMVRSFINQAPADRLLMVKSLVAGKTWRWQQDIFLKTISEYLGKIASQNQSLAESCWLSIKRLKKYSTTNHFSAKILLEELALSWPNNN